MKTYTYKAKDGTTITGIPEDIKPDDPRLYEYYKQMKAAGQMTGTFSAQPSGEEAMLAAAARQAPSAAVEAPKPTPLQVAGQAIAELPQNAGVAARGLVKGAMSLPTMIADPVTALVNKILPPEYQQLPPSQGIEAMFAKLGVKDPQTKAQEVLESLTMGLGSGAAGLATGAALATGAPALGMGTVRQEAGKALMTGPIQQLLGSVGAEEGATLARQRGAGPLLQFGAGMAGGLAGGAAGSALSLQPAGVHPMQAAVDDSAKLRTQLMTSDVYPPESFAARTGQALSEKIPVIGTGPVRATQQADRIADVKDLLLQYGAEGTAAASDDVMADMLEKRAGSLTRWTSMKDKVIDDLSIPKLTDTAVPGGPLQIAATSDQVPSRVVPMPATTKKIGDSITYLKQLKTEQVKPVIAILEDWGKSIQGQDLKNIETLRKQVGEAFTAPDMAAVRSTGQRVLSDIYGAVKDDMTKYIGTAGSPQALNKWQVANKELSKLMGDLDLGIMKTTLEKGVDRPEVVKNMLFSKDRSVIQALNKSLTAKGRESARAAIMQEVGKKIGEEASPERFLTELRKLKAGGDPVGVFFTGDDLKAVEGLTRVLKATTRASKAALNPPTGIQAVIPISALGMAGGSVALEKYFGQGLPALLASVGIVGTAGGAARLYESPTFRNILMKLPTVKPGSVEEAALFKRLIEAAQSVKPKKDEALER